MFFLYSCLHCIGTLAMGRVFDFLSAFYIGVWEMKNIFLYSCLHCIGTLAMGRTFDFLSVFYIGVREMKNVFFVFLSAWNWYPGNGKRIRFHVFILPAFFPFK
jgi:hypothetical protein